MAVLLLFFLLFVPLSIWRGEYLTLREYVRCSRDVEMSYVYSLGLAAYIVSIIFLCMARKYEKSGGKYHFETCAWTLTGTIGLFVFPYQYYDLMKEYPRNTWNWSLGTLDIMFVLPAVAVFICLYVLFSDRNQDKTKNTMFKQKAAIDVATGKQTFQAGDLVVDKQGNQMRVTGYADGFYSCSKGNIFIGDFLEEELQKFDDYVNSSNRK